MPAPNAPASFPHTQDLETHLRAPWSISTNAPKKELGYNATYLVRMLADVGSVATAQRLVMSDHASDGFVYLWDHQRLDLSVEALVI